MKSFISSGEDFDLTIDFQLLKRMIEYSNFNLDKANQVLAPFRGIPEVTRYAGV